MDAPLNHLKHTLKRAGYSLTHPREAVFMALQNQEPLTIGELVAACSGINRASIYRTLDLFEKLGVVHRLQIGWKYKVELSEPFHYHHHHLSCQSCGRIIPFEEDEAFQNSLSLIAATHSFDMVGHQLEIQGICDKCSARSK